MRIEQIKKQKCALTFVVANLFQLILIFIAHKYLKNPIFGTNDDFYLAALVQGNLLGKPTMEMFYIGPIFTIFPYFLSLLFTSLAWYSITLLVFLIFAQSFLISSIIRHVNTIYSQICLILYWTVISSTGLIWNYLQPTFTSISIITMGIGVVTYYTINFDNFSKNKKLILSSFIIIILSVSLRWESLYLAFPLILIISIFLIFSDKLKFRSVTLLTLPLFSIFGLARFLETFIFKKFLSSEWVNYFELMSKVDLVQPSDNRYLSKKYLESEIFSNTYWNETLFSLFSNFVLFDSKYYSVVSLTQLSQVVEASQFNALKFFLSNSETSAIVGQYYNQYFFLFTFVLILSLLTLVFLKVKNRLLFLLFSFLSFLGFSIVMLFLQTSYKLPERVYFSMIYLIVLLVFFFLSKTLDESFVRNFLGYQFLILALIAFIIFVSSFANEVKARDDYFFQLKKTSRQDYRIFNQLPNSGLFIGNLSSVKASWINPYKKSQINSRLKGLIPLGWFNTSPAWNSYISSLNVNTENLALELVQNEGGYFVTNVNLVETIQDFLELHLQIKVSREIIFQNEELIILKFTKASPIFSEQLF